MAVEAFGKQTPLTQKVCGVQLQIPGINPRSLLAQEFARTWDFIVAPHDLSERYDMLLGVNFMHAVGLGLSFQKPCSVRMRALDGLETMVMEQSDPDSEEESTGNGRRRTRM